jgi:iron(III) transport system ATP-binding protein
MNTLTVEGVTKAYHNAAVLHGLSLTAPNGALTAVLGASGSGKTTLLRVVAGFERAGLGRVVLGSQELEGPQTFVAPERRGIGYVSQDGSLFPHLSAAANVGFGLPRSERRGRRVDELLELVGLAGLGRRFPHELSGGEQQRVSLARALAPRPRLILMDEPFSALDASLRATLRDDVRAVLKAAGVTAILVTHDQDEALSLADQVAVLRGGVIVQAGPPPQLYERPADAALARFLGHANFVDGTVDGGKVSTVLGEVLLAQGTGLADGHGAVLLLRPEQLKVTAPGLRGSRDVVIERCQYFGHDAVVEASDPLEGSREAWTLRVPGHEAPTVGSRVGLRFQGEAWGWRKQEDHKPRFPLS